MENKSREEETKAQKGKKESRQNDNISQKRKKEKKKRTEQGKKRNKGKGKRGEIISKLHENDKDMLKYRSNYYNIIKIGYYLNSLDFKYETKNV